MRLRPEQPGDDTAVSAVHRLAFGGNRVDGSGVPALVADLRPLIEEFGGLSLVAEDSGEVVGHVMFTRSILDAPRRLVDVQVLSPIGVLPSRQGEGIGSALIGAGVEMLAESGVPLVFLEGAPGYYGRFGFLPGGEHGFRKPSLRIPDASFQVMMLPAYEPFMTGTLVYSEVFWRHDAVGLRDPDASESEPA